MTVLQCITLCIAYASASLVWVDNMQPPGGTNHFVWKGNCCFDVLVQTKVTEGSTALCYVTSDVSGKTEEYPMLLDEDLGNNIHQHFATLQVSNTRPGQYNYHAYCRDSSDGTLMKLAAGKPGILHISERQAQGSPKRQDASTDTNPSGGDTNSPPQSSSPPDMTSCDADFSSSTSEDQTSTSTSTSSSSPSPIATSSSVKTSSTSSEAPKTPGPGKTTSPPKTSAPRTSTSSSTSDQVDTTSDSGSSTTASSSKDGVASTSASSTRTRISRTQSSTSQVETSSSRAETSQASQETSQTSQSTSQKTSQTSQTTSQEPSSTFQVETSTPASTSTSTSTPSGTCDTFVPRTMCLDMVCLNGNFVENSGNGFLIPSSGTKSIPDQVPTDSTKVLTFVKKGITGTLIASTYTKLRLQVDSGTNSGKGYNARVSYDFEGDSTWDRVELYKLFATNPIVDYETFEFVASPTNTKVSINTVALSDMKNGAVRLEVWQALPSSTNGTLLVNGPVNSPTGVKETTLQIPYMSVSVSESGTCQVTSSGNGRATADGTAGPDGRESTSDGFKLNSKLSVVAALIVFLAL